MKITATTLAVWGLSIISLVACNQDQSVPATIGQVAQETARAPLIATASEHLTLVGCTIPSRAIDGVCINTPVATLRSKSDACDFNPKCIELIKEWDREHGTKFRQFQ